MSSQITIRLGICCVVGLGMAIAETECQAQCSSRGGAGPAMSGSLAASGFGFAAPLSANRGFNTANFSPQLRQLSPIQQMQQTVFAARQQSQMRQAMRARARDQASLLEMRQLRAERTRALRAERIARARAKREAERANSPESEGGQVLVSTRSPI